MRLFVCVFIEKLPWRQRNRAQQKSVAQPSPAQPRTGPPQTLTKKLLFPLWPTHITRLPLPKTHCYLITFFKCSLHRLSVTQYTTGLYIIQLKPLLMPQQRTHHQGPQQLERRFRDNRGLLLESRRMLLLYKQFCLHENTIQ